MAWIEPAEPCTSSDGRHQREVRGSAQQEIIRAWCPVCMQPWRRVDDEAASATGG